MSDLKKIVWLASYPKSGNTWFRAFLSALLNEEAVEINQIKTDGMFSSRTLLDQYIDLDSTLLTDAEVKILLPEVFTLIASESKKEKLFFKVHDAYSNNLLTLPIIPSKSTFCAVYIIRNPLDVAASLANHIQTSIDKAIDLMNDKMGCFANQKGNFNINNQTRQLMYDWSKHVNSWTLRPDFRVHVIRYEDMILKTFETFQKAVKALDLAYNDYQIKTAIESSSFEQLKKQELTNGFNEKALESPIFFRNGMKGNWKKELNDSQIQKIISHHKVVMDRFDYLP